MLGVALGLQPQYGGRVSVPFPPGFAWDQGRFRFDVNKSGSRFEADLNPRDLVDPAIWSGPALHVAVAGDDSNSGLGAQDGDFSDAKRTIYGAFVAGNATGAAYRVIVNGGNMRAAPFTRNGNDEPTQAIALLAHGGVSPDRRRGRSGTGF